VTLVAMPAICLFVAGTLRATLPGPELTVSWVHSVQKSGWEERYGVEGDHLVLREARVQGSGAGMEPGSDAVLRDGWWTWAPQRRLPAITLTTSTFTDDYTICAGDRCAPLRTLVATEREGEAVLVAPCPGRAASQGG
jgi:hypothetical protein